MDILSIRFLDILDIVLIATLLYNIYKLVRGTVAVNIFIGIAIIYLVWRLTQLLQMELLSNVLDQFVGVGMFALIVVFQQEIRKFLLMIGSANLTYNGKFFKNLRFVRNISDDDDNSTIDLIVNACESMSKTKTGALIVIRRNTSLDFIKKSGDSMDIELNQPIIESIFFKNSPLHDGAMVIEGNKITATRVILPVSNDRSIPLRFGLRHRAAVGISEKTDALAIVVSEETGQISYIRDGEFTMFESNDELRERLKENLR
ncbi:diadenylate cyclase CdaA [Zunongwangia sp.]|uniref:diadenylate cyclase CdaA n=1 Tax=Zunongwangia sp. TaxID=1965325 RepID=UPI003AA8C5A6